MIEEARFVCSNCQTQEGAGCGDCVDQTGGMCDCDRPDHTYVPPAPTDDPEAENEIAAILMKRTGWVPLSARYALASDVVRWMQEHRPVEALRAENERLLQRNILLVNLNTAALAREGALRAGVEALADPETLANLIDPDSRDPRPVDRENWPDVWRVLDALRALLTEPVEHKRPDVAGPVVWGDGAPRPLDGEQ